MTKRAVLAGVALALMLAPLGCKGKEVPAPSGRPIAVVAGTAISEGAFNFFLNERMRQHAGAGFTVSAEAIRDAVMQDVIVERLMALGAREKGIEVGDDEVNVHVEAIREQEGQAALAAALSEAGITEEEYRVIVRDRILSLRFAESLVPDDSVTEKDVKAFYKDSPTPFLNPETFLISFIEVTDLARAKQLMGDIGKKGYKAVSESILNSPGVMVGGYGWATSGMFPSEEVADGLARTGKGGIGGPFAAGGTYYIFHMKDRKAERPMTLDEAAPQIRSILLRQNRDAAVFHWVEEKKKQVEFTSN